MRRSCSFNEIFNYTSLCLLLLPCSLPMVTAVTSVRDFEIFENQITARLETLESFEQLRFVYLWWLLWRQLGILKLLKIRSQQDLTHPVKVNLNKELDPKLKTIQAFNIFALGSEKLEMKILPHGKKELPANQCWPTCQPWADWPTLVSW